MAKVKASSLTITCLVRGVSYCHCVLYDTRMGAKGGTHIGTAGAVIDGSPSGWAKFSGLLFSPAAVAGALVRRVAIVLIYLSKQIGDGIGIG